MKKLLITAAALCLLAACQDKTQPEPEPEEYFSFYADGQYNNYPQKKGLGFGGTGQTLKAIRGSATTGYRISAWDYNSNAQGGISITFSGSNMPDKDTIILTSVGINDFKQSSGGDYILRPPLTGKVIFSERSNTKLTGTFEFQAFRIGYDENGSNYLTDTIITITDGKFSIIPTN